MGLEEAGSDKEEEAPTWKNGEEHAAATVIEGRGFQ